MVIGTRPEAIKMAPILIRLRTEPETFAVRTCVTAQHREMLDSVFRVFELEPDVDLDLMQPGQDLNALAGRVLIHLDPVLADEAPDWVLVQGDTTTVMAASLAAFHRRIPVAHVEAGLRTGDLARPFPEEMNRRVTDLIADLHFAPTQRAAAELRRERVEPQRIHVTGNTVVDALHYIAARQGEAPAPERLVLVTCHRRESFGEPMRRTFRALRRLAQRFPDVRFVFPVHPNPQVVEAVDEELASVPNVELRSPADYLQLVAWLRRATLVITDSGGLQEEAPAFGKPTLVLRQATERPEGVEAGVARLVGTDEDLIFREGERLLSDPEALAAMARIANPYGDGAAAGRIADLLAGRPVVPFLPE